METKYILDIRDMSKSYGGKVILGDVDLRIRQGEFVTLVGPSGCGKSTLLRMVLGMEKPTGATHFLVDGQPVEGPDITRGVVFQNYSLFPHMSALGNVLIGKKVHKGLWHYFENRQRYLKEARFFLDKVGLIESEKMRPDQLSGGMQQRVAIAQALIMKQKILFMDEPFGALDMVTRDQMQQFMIELWKETKMTIFFITHDVEEAFLLGSRLIGLSQHFVEGPVDRPNKNHGARVVFDVDVSRLRDKGQAAFGEATQRLMRECYDPKCKVHVTKFILEHPDAIATFTPEQRGEPASTRV